MSFPKLSFAGLDEFEPREGGQGRPLLDYEGNDPVTILSCTPVVKDIENPAKTKAWVVVKVKNENPDASGAVMTTNVMYYGKSKDGDNLASMFSQFLWSIGQTTAEKVRGHAKENKEFEIEDVCKVAVGKKGFVYHQWTVYNNREYSDIKSWISAETYAKLEENGALKTKVRRPGEERVSNGASGPSAAASEKGTFRPDI